MRFYIHPIKITKLPYPEYFDKKMWAPNLRMNSGYSALEPQGKYGVSVELSWGKSETINEIYIPINSEFNTEWINIESDIHGDIVISTDHVTPLTVDKRAFLIAVVLTTKLFGGVISTDAKQTWMPLDEFELEYADYLKMSFERALVYTEPEIFTLDATNEPEPPDVQDLFE
ncbi:hypothetical protein EQG49_00450 [Periweissella cryptocerci]|uniref:Uncharacterized protein n=1 Tax=Periweissella cryptocerci TaxID=2506420 RepID=A0A4P6YQZ2_9LACO|nr:hypothetical protein [Periweissella cryptocerci]QBO35024.1 hypothetical protein EQG49_00450 [Periweissella cryptocerci]